MDPQTGEPLPDGEWGVLILSSMTRTALPLLRYWTGDITRLLPGPNGTGRTLRRMDAVRGRSDDLIILRGVNVYPAQLEDALLRLGQTSPHYHVTLTRSGLLDELTLQLEVAAPAVSAAALAAEVERQVKDQVGVTIRCQPCEPGSLPRSEGGKLRRVTDLRQQR